ncbi:ABC-2 type transport system permease protein [Methanomicrobium sp. W14]|nr:ABC transporter permease subunit [Methanomicrobium sp. W14]MBP2134531.1 ABC-2 type transport system permease protein [Methanomicrobium sp. W14]
MNAQRLFIVAEKEFFDQISGKKFLALFFMMLVLAGVSVISEYNSYESEMEAYANSGSSYIDEYGTAHYGGATYNPSVVNIYHGIVSGLSGYIFGPLIAITAGFDLITRERRSNSIKSILSHPVYRDELINGKALGGIAALGTATVCLFLIVTAALLIMSVVPSGSDIFSIILLFAFTVLYLTCIFTLALMVSSLSKNSGSSLIYSLILFIVFSYIATIAAPIVTDLVVGPEPGNFDSGSSVFSDSGDLSSYYSNRDTVESTVEYFSIKNNYYCIGTALTQPSFFWAFKGKGDGASGFYDYSKMGVDFWDILSKLWGNIIFLIAYPVVFFGIAYVKFMRMDLR